MKVAGTLPEITQDNLTGRISGVPVKVAYFSLKQDTAVVRAVKADRAKYADVGTSKNSYRSGFCIYIVKRNTIRLIAWSISSGNEYATKYRRRKEDHFWVFLKKRKPKTIIDVAYCLAVYPERLDRKRWGPEPVSSSELPAKDKEVLTTLLHDTGGCLLWNYQLENIFRAYLSSDEQVASLMKGVRRADASTWDELRRIKIRPKVTLADIVGSVFSNWNVAKPNFAGARILVEHLRVMKKMH